MNTKRIFSFILAAAIMLSLLATGAAVSAATQISIVDLSGFHMLVGESLSETLTTGEYGTVSSVAWEKWNYTTNAWEAYSGEIVGATAYRLTARIDPAEGYSFPYKCEYTIDSGDVLGYAYRSGGGVEVVHVFPVGVQMLSSVTVDAVPEIKTGDDSAEAASQLKLAPGENCSIVATEWFYRTAPFVASYDPFEGAFRARADYKLYVDIAPMPGYWFGDDVAVQADHYGDSFRSGDAFMVIMLQYETSQSVENIEITVTGLEEGKNAEDVTVTLPDGAPYEIYMVEILDSENHTVTGTLGKDKYLVYVYVSPVGDYRFTYDTFLIVNGEVVGGGCPEYDFGEAVYTADFRTPIESVEITVTGLEQGKNAADVQIALAEDAPYTLVHLDILDYKKKVFKSTFAAAEYYAEIYLEPKEGYCFTDDTVAFVNDTPLATYYNEDRNYLNIELHKDFRTGIDKVEITLSELNHAMDAAQAIAGVAVSETADYTVEQVLILDQSGNAVEGSLTESDYRYNIRIKAKDGYCMDAQAVEVYINGVKAENFSVANYGFDLQVGADYYLCEFTAKVTAPTCTEGGYITYTCGGCGDAYTDNVTAALGHSYKNGVCAVCGGEDPDAPRGVTLSGSYKAFGDTADVITVQLIPSGATEAAYTFTNEDTAANSGVWSITGVEAGTYTATVSKLNHVTREYALTVSDSAVTLDVEIWLLGDANGDGRVNFSDYTKVLSQAKNPGTGPLEGYDLDCGDVTGDGRINFSDYVKVLSQAKGQNPIW